MPIQIFRAVALAVAKAVAQAAALLPIAATCWPLPASAAPLSLDAALELAVARSEATRSARAGLSSATESARAAGQLPDPMLRAGIENLPVTGADRLHTARDSMTMKRLGIAQEWLSADKRAARQSTADAIVGRETNAVRTATAQTRLQTALAYLDAWYAGETLALTTLATHHAHEELEAARARLSSSSGNSAEVLAMTGALGSAEDASAEALQQQSSATLALQRWVGVAPEALTPVAVATVPTEPAFVEAHPAVLALQRDLQVARQAAAATASERRPNWTWEVSYGQRTGYADMVSVGVSIPLPIAPEQRQDRDTASKLALADKAEADLAEATRAATTEYRTIASEAQRLRERIDRYRTGVVVPAAQRTAVATAAYRSNQFPLTTLFEARHAEVEVQRRLLALQRELARTQAQLAFKPIDQGVSR